MHEGRQQLPGYLVNTLMMAVHAMQTSLPYVGHGASDYTYRLLVRCIALPLPPVLDALATIFDGLLIAEPVGPVPSRNKQNASKGTRTGKGRARQSLTEAREGLQQVQAQLVDKVSLHGLLYACCATVYRACHFANASTMLLKGRCERCVPQPVFGIVTGISKHRKT
jgi:hypothetical protein